MATPSQLLPLTGARFIAAFSVLVAHACPVIVFKDTSFYFHFSVPLALFGMSLFFVLSGFVIHLNYSQLFISQPRGLAIRKFAVARFARLYPLFIFFVAIAVTNNLWPDLQTLLPGAFLYLPLLQSWFSANGSTILTLSLPSLAHTWSVSTEVFFYVCFPVLAVLLAKWRSAKSCLMGTVAFFILAYVALYIVYRYNSSYLPFIAPALNPQQGLYWFAYLSPYTRVFEFIAGVLTAHLFILMREMPPSPRESAWASHIAIAAALALLGVGIASGTNPNLQSIDNYFSFVRLNFIFAPAIACLLFFVARYESRFQKLLSTSVAIRGGEISYSIYLLHPFLLVRFSNPTNPALSVESVFEWVTRVSCGVAFVIILAQGSYTLVELPARKWLRAKLEPSLSK